MKVLLLFASWALFFTAGFVLNGILHFLSDADDLDEALYTLAHTATPDLDDSSVERLIQQVFDWANDDQFDRDLLWEGRTTEPHELPWRARNDPDDGGEAA